MSFHNNYLTKKIHTVQVKLGKCEQIGRGYQCPYPACDDVFYFRKMLPLGEIGGKVHSVFLYYFLQPHVNHKLAQ